MYGEINRNNLPPEVTFKVFLSLCEEGFKDPVLKNYLIILELIQKALPIYFRYLKPEQIKEELAPLIKTILKKTSDLKSKIREASINFCLYLSHQSPIGPETMIREVLDELNEVQKEQKQDQPKTPGPGATRTKLSGTTSAVVSTSFGNSHLIASCLMLLSQFQQ